MMALKKVQVHNPEAFMFHVHLQHLIENEGAKKIFIIKINC